jgi:hypothetical protein
MGHPAPEPMIKKRRERTRIQVLAPLDTFRGRKRAISRSNGRMHRQTLGCFLQKQLPPADLMSMIDA